MPKIKPITSELREAGSKIPSRQVLYNKIAVHADDIIAKLLELTNSKNENIKLGALNKLSDKLLPDIKSVELSGNEGGDIILRLVREDKTLYGDSTTHPQLPEAGNNL